MVVLHAYTSACSTCTNQSHVRFNLESSDSTPNHHRDYAPQRTRSHRYEDDQVFGQVQANVLNAARVVDGSWYLVVKGDYAGRVSGAVYDIRNDTTPVRIPTSVGAVGNQGGGG
jgi:hypothetical protein